MLKIRLTVVNKDWGSKTTKTLYFESLEELSKHFHQSYIKELLQKGSFTIHHYTVEDPRDTSYCNGYERYKLIT